MRPDTSDQLQRDAALSPRFQTSSKLLGEAVRRWCNAVYSRTERSSRSSSKSSQLPFQGRPLTSAYVIASPRISLKLSNNEEGEETQSFSNQIVISALPCPGDPGVLLKEPVDPGVLLKDPGVL